jgi:hypothetical protein
LFLCLGARRNLLHNGGMGLSEQGKGFINNLVAGAAWDGIKQLWGPVVLAAIVAFWQKLKHGSLDWVAVVGMFLVASVLAFLNFRKPKWPPEGKPQQGRPKWQRLQWANAERQRLEAENIRLKDELAKVRSAASELEAVSTKSNNNTNGSLDVFRDPKWQIVDDHTFKNETVELDGKKFWRCKFENVTLLFHGKAPTEFAAGNEFRPPLLLKTDNPAAMLFASLSQMFRKGSEILGRITNEGMADSRGKPFPDDISIRVAETKSENEERQKTLTANPIPQLRLKVLSLCSELQGFLSTYGEEPKIDRGLTETEEMYAQRWRKTVEPWRAKFFGAYRLRFGESLPHLQDGD